SAERLLKGSDFEKGVNDVLEKLGTATHSSRVYIFERESPRVDDGETCVTQRYEWATPGIPPQIYNPDLTNFPLRQMGFERWIDQFSQNKPIHDYVDEMPGGEQAVLSSQDILSIAVMPIVVDHAWWGFIGFDECATRRRWSVAELEALRVAAGTLGAAIQRQKAEHDLQTQHDFAQKILNHMGQGLTVTDNDRHFVYVNPAYSKIIGRTPEDLLGKSPLDFTVQTDHAALDQALARRRQGQTDTYETRLLHADGHEIPVTITGVPRWHEGKVAGTIAVVTDLTERKRAEQALRESQAQLEGIFNSTMDAIVTIDNDQRIIIFNPAAEKLFMCPAGEAIGQTLDRFIPEKVRQDHRSFIRTFGSHDSSKRSMETPTLALTCLRANGEAFPSEISISHLAIGGRDLYTAIIRDITERKRAEEALRDSEERFRALIESGRDNISMLAADGTLLWESPTTTSTLGYAPNQFVGGNIFELMHPDDKAWTWDLFEQVAQTPGRSHEGIFRLRHSNGSWLWIESTATNLIHKPSVGAIVINYRDITERKKAEDALQRQTKELIAIYESAQRLQQLRAPDELTREIILSLEHILNYTFSSVLLIEEASGRLLPFAISEQRRGETFREIDAAYISSREPRVGKGITGWVAQSGEAACIGDVTKDPRYYSVRQDIRSELCVPLKVNDQIIGVVNIESLQPNAYDESDQRVLGTIAAQIATAIQNSRLYDQVQQELAERKKVEDALRENQSHLQLIMDRMPVACILNNADSQVIYWNKAAEKVFGYTAEEMLGKAPSFLIAPTARDHMRAIYQRIVAGDMNAHGTNENITKDGRIILCEWVNAPIQDEHGNFVGFLGMAQDVTERKKAEEQLRKLSLAVEQSPASIVITNTRGEIEYVNPKFKDITGYAAAEIIGQNSRFLKSGYTSGDEYKNLWSTITGGREWRGKFLNKKKNGDLYWESASISPIVNDAGEITHYLAVKEDITEREHREQELEAIAAISLALRAAPTRKEMLPIILDQLHRLFHSDGEAISLINPLNNDVVVELGINTFAAANGIRLPAGQGVSGLVIQSGQPYLSNDAQHDPNFARNDILQGINAFACVPLNTHDTTLGILWIERASNITSTDVRVLVAIADIAATAIQRAALHEQTMRQVERLTALRTVDSGISNSFDMRVTLNILI
ncbi:MAG: PAS domain S-box protein, partial [Chloroflexi bacterium]|nr:PAS domain S-box protein [Chloroflexota bacterium]